MGDPVRLQKIMAQAGLGSRRACEGIILDGRVSVDGVVVTHLGSKADLETQTVSVDGQKISGPRGSSRKKNLASSPPIVAYALNKPKGVLCTNQDPAGRPLAIHFIKEPRRIFCVGRLDMETEGLILLTNDGELTNLLTHPRFGIPKTYWAWVSERVTGEQITKLCRGVHLAEGKTKGAYVKIRKRSKSGSVLELVIREGMNREIRRMLAAVGLSCRRLRRVGIGRLKLGSLPLGTYRLLNKVEVEGLRTQALKFFKEKNENAPSIKKNHNKNQRRTCQMPPP